MDALEGVQRVAAAPNECIAIDEMSMLLCEVLQGSQCDVYPVETTDGQDVLKINYRTFIPVRYHGLLWRGDYSLESEKAGKPVSYANLELSERGHASSRDHSHARSANDKDEDHRAGVLEWYEPRTGFRERFDKIVGEIAIRKR